MPSSPSHTERCTKIVATIGPATIKPDVLKQLILAGATTLRLNFSHGTHDDHLKSIRLIRQTGFELNQPIAILQDLQGPKIRLGTFPDGPVEVKQDDTYILTSQKTSCTKEIGYVSYEKLVEEVPTGATILVDDGKVEMVVEKVVPATQSIYCRVVVGGKLSNNKGVNFPGVCLSIKALTDKDREDLVFGLDQGVDWVALSFVRNPADVIEIKELIANAGKNVPVIVKIEKHEAITQMEEILSLSDGVMIARGDLGVELPAEDVPLLQKQLINTANRLGIPIITATQMLDSMVSCPRPTRAEVSDVANAILDGTDAVMLSNETAVGDYPIEAVRTMDRIARRIESDRKQNKANYISLAHHDFGQNKISSIPNAIASAVGQIAETLGSAAIMSLTKTGATARNVSKFRPQTPILAVTPHMDVARQLQLVWGAQPLLVLDFPSTSETFQAAISLAQEKQLLADGDLIVMTAGTLQGVPGSTDLIKVEVVTATMGKGVGIGHGSVTGRARVASGVQELNDFSPGDILVVNKTNAEYMEIIRKAAGIVTEEESLTSHAAVIGLRLGIPVVTGLNKAMETIRDGSIITIDGQSGMVYAGAKKNNVGSHGTIDLPIP
jgi:pyruvate kinase